MMTFDFLGPTVAWLSPFFLVVVLLALAALWILEFAQLMRMRDDQFAGRYDKYVWAVAFLLASVLGALAFFVWRTVLGGGRARGSSRLSPPPQFQDIDVPK
jgi:hypothetical protein